MASPGPSGSLQVPLLFTPRGTVFCVTFSGGAPPVAGVIGCTGRLQCDMLRPGRLPAVLVGDGRLGGISATIAAVEVSQSNCIGAHDFMWARHPRQALH